MNVVPVIGVSEPWSTGRGEAGGTPPLLEGPPRRAAPPTAAVEAPRRTGGAGTTASRWPQTLAGPYAPKDDGADAELTGLGGDVDHIPSGQLGVAASVAWFDELR